MDLSTGKCLLLFLTSETGSTCNGHSLWIMCEVVLATLTGILVYICACLARFAWLVNGAPKVITKRGATTATTDEEGWRNKDKFLEIYGTKHKRIMVYVCLLASVVTLLKLLLDQIKFFYIWNARSDYLCELASDVSDIFMFFCALLSIYGFLWMKQWLFYRDPAAVGIVYNRKLVSFSRLFVVVFGALGFANFVVNLIPTRFQACNSTAPVGDVTALANDVTYVGCVSIYSMTNLSESWQLIWYAVLAALQQGILLGLFIYPVIKHKRDLAKLAPRHALQAKSKITVPECPDRPRAATSVLSNNALRTIKRAIFWTVICEITDIMLFVLTSVRGPGVPLIVISLAFDLNLFIDVICLIASYNTWRNILFPLCAGDVAIGGKRPSASARKKKTSDRACGRDTNCI